ncbi:MAG: hypothetical protein J7642_22295 [Cyanobacteria bacterium SBC]|nr:hypothetical protein [Cyanobacteria bacterium SBC]
MILWIDDESRRVKVYLEELDLCGYKVVLKEDIDEALKFWENHKNEIQLIILDIMMPIGKNFSESERQEAEYGLNTGIFIHDKYFKDGQSTVIFFTHLSSVNFEDDDKNIQTHLLKKIDYLPSEFSQKVEEILKQS